MIDFAEKRDYDKYIKAHLERVTFLWKSIFPHKQKIKDERGVALEKLVAIIDKMPEYGERLAKYLNAGRNFPYRAVVFSTAKEVESYMKSDGVYAVLTWLSWRLENSLESLM